MNDFHDIIFKVSTNLVITIVIIIIILDYHVATLALTLIL